MLPLIDVPILHDVVKECIDAGITKIVIVTRHGNNAVEDYFDNNKELEDYLKQLGKFDRYERFLEVFDQADIAYVRQNKNMPYGNGSPALAAKPYITEGKPFAYLYGDDLVLAKRSGIGQIIGRFEQLIAEGKNIGGVLASQSVALEEVSKYGIFKYRDVHNQIIDSISEKPKAEDAPSNQLSYGRYVLSYDVFKYLDIEKTGKDNELWMVDAITELARHLDVYTHTIDGTWFTTGDPVNMMRATLSYALAREDLRTEVLAMLSDLLQKTPR